MKRCIPASLWLLAASMLLAAPASATLRGKELRLDDPQVRAYMEENLLPPYVPPPTDAELRALEEVYDNGDRYEAERVAWVLGDWPSPANGKLLLKACGSEWPAVRARAAASLGQLAGVLSPEGLERAEAALLGLLSDADRRVALAAIRSLGRLKARRAAGALSRFVSSQDTELAVAAVRALGELGERANAELILPALNAGDTDVATAAIEALTALKDPALAEHLVAKLGSQSPAERLAAIRGIAKLKAAEHEDALMGLLSDAHGYVRREALKALVEMGGARHEQLYLKMTRDPDASVRRVAAQAIGRFGLRSGIPALGALFSDPHLYVRDDAVISLASLGGEQVVELAARGLASEVDTVRACASQLLGRLKSDRNLQQHIALLKDRYLPARRWAAWALGEIGRPEACDALYDCAFAEDQDLETALCAMLSLGKLGCKKALPKFQQHVPKKYHLTDTPAELTQRRLIAIRAIGLMRDESSVMLLVGRLTDLNKIYPELNEVRYQAAIALGRIGSEKAAKALRTHMSMAGEPYELQHACRWSLGQILGSLPDYHVSPPERREKYFLRPIAVTSPAPAGQ